MDTFRFFRTDYLVDYFFQPNPFLPDGEVAKDAQSLLEKMKTKKNSYNTLECKSKLLLHFVTYPVD